VRGANPPRFGGLGGRRGERGDFAPERPGELEGEMPETADADHAHA
jgi:hypothetical protein